MKKTIEEIEQENTMVNQFIILIFIATTHFYSYTHFGWKSNALLIFMSVLSAISTKIVIKKFNH